MNTATSLLVRTAPEPQFGMSSAAPDQVPLPLAGAQLQFMSVASTRPGGPLQRRAAQFVQVLVEVLTGERPARQLGAWMSPDVYEQLQQQLQSSMRRPQRACIASGTRIASVHVAMISDTAAEIAARMTRSGRSRALAVRLELHTTLRGLRQWRCTALTWA